MPKTRDAAGEEAEYRIAARNRRIRPVLALSKYRPALIPGSPTAR